MSRSKALFCAGSLILIAFVAIWLFQQQWVGWILASGNTTLIQGLVFLAERDLLINSKPNLFHFLPANANPISISFLVKTGMNINQKDLFGRTPLHRQVIMSFEKNCSGCKNVIQGLLENGASVDEYDKDGNSPLHLAFLDFSPPSPEIVSTLVRFGSKLDKVNGRGKTPIDLDLWGLLGTSSNTKWIER